MIDENKYDEAINAVAEQLAAMVVADGGDEDMLSDYLGDAVSDIQRKAVELLKNQ